LYQSYTYTNRSQVQRETLPADLPFRIISKTIGCGAYAFIRKACPIKAYKPVIAVKFIHKEHAYKLGRVKPKQIQTEIALHRHVGAHQNIIQYLADGDDHTWTWIAMELADGDLFDKIEADEGVGEDIAHFYFSQLISAVGYIHSRGVAHRDIKPENILLADGDLKLADFGLAVLYGFNGQKKLCQTVCGSPPYMAPEVVPKDGFTGQKTAPYEANTADVWSCGIVLFVLLIGNTPWDEPTRNSYEFNDYLTNGATDDLWRRIPHGALSLVRGMLNTNPQSRLTLEAIRQHPWFTRRNPHLTSDGRAANPLHLATQMLENLHINFDSNPLTSSSQQSRNAQSAETMDIDSFGGRLALTQPDAPIAEPDLDWERPSLLAATGISASQPIAAHPLPLTSRTTTGWHPAASQAAAERFLTDPALSQFSQTPSVPMSVTQQARRFRDIVPETSLARFLSFMDFPLLLPLICEALRRLGIPVGNVSPEPTDQEGYEGGYGAMRAFVPIKTRDQRACLLAGTVIVERVEADVLEVRFLKAKGDPLEWRRLFKKVAVLCKDGILRPEG
jgi:serine/threonine-protein kinase Chk1